MAARIERAWHRDLRAYPEYKESGVEWLGEIPEHWAVNRLRTTVTGCQNGVWGEEADGVHDLLCVRVADFDRGRFRVRMDEPTLRAIDPRIARSRRLEHDDLLLEKSGGGDKQPVAAVVMYDHDQPAVCSNFVARMPVADDHDPRYLTYLHATLYAARVNVRSIKQNTGIQNLDSASYLSEAVAVPPGKEQHAIAEFLDRETAKIDALVARKERLIELLQEKRTALITRAVTRGLDPNIPMKDSGVEWLGEIPAHWEVSRVAMAVNQITNGYVGPTRDILVDDGVRYLQSLHIKNGRIEFDRKPYFVTEHWSEQHRKSVLREGDVLVVQTGDIGQNCVVSAAFEGVNCHALIILRLKPHLGVGAFLSLLLQSTYGQNALKRSQTGALHPHLECGHVREIRLALPPPAEQRLIVTAVKEQREALDSLQVKVAQAMERLKELRTALISAAVTGKIDVREAVPR